MVQTHQPSVAEELLAHRIKIIAGRWIRNVPGLWCRPEWIVTTQVRMLCRDGLHDIVHFRALLGITEPEMKVFQNTHETHHEEHLR